MTQVAGITVERTLKGRPRFVRIDLRKHVEFIPMLEKKGVDVNEPIKWTAKMKQAFAESENGETCLGDINNFWNV